MSSHKYSSILLSLSLLLSILPAFTTAFYLPGVAPKDYVNGASIDVDVNSLSSNTTVIPYDFYLPQFGFCRPDVIESRGESLGSVLFGDRLKNAPFSVKMNVNQSCQVVCKQTIPAQKAKFINQRIRERYQIHMLVDNLPTARKLESKNKDIHMYATAFELGRVFGNPAKPGHKVFLNNHYDIIVEVHTEDNTHYRVVGVLLYPYSVRNPKEDGACNYYDDQTAPLELSETANTEVTYSYNVHFVPSTKKWSERWNWYLTNSEAEARIHWFSLINSVIIVIFLTAMVAMILLRALHKDIARYNSLEAQEEAQEEFGWKLVHADVFRTPQYPMILSTYVGAGAQLFLMTGVTLVFAVLGFLSPSSSGALMTVMLFFYVFFGLVSGYVSARLYKMFGGESWRSTVVMSAFGVPGIIFGIFTFLNFFLIGAESSAAVPAGTFFALIAMWFLISAPLSFVGSYFGFKAPRIEYPVRTNQIPRQIPDQPFYIQLIPSMIMGGILPFGAIFIELFFIMNSIWAHRIYYLFGFVFLVFFILVLTCSEVTILMCYFHLCAEDYNWWWRSFLTSSASSFYVFGASVMYFVTKLHMQDFTSGVLYFGWSAVISILFFMLTGAIGFTACFFFVRKIYGSIKID